MPMCHGLWSRVRRPREESTPSTRPLFSNIHPPCPLLCVCVPFRGCPVLGPRPGVGHKRRTPPRHLTGWKIKTKHPAPPLLAKRVHCMMTFGATLSLLLVSYFFFFCSHLFGPGPIILPARLAHDLWTQGYSALLASTCRGNDLWLHFLFVGQSAVNHLGCSTLHFFSCWRVQPFGLVSPLLLLLTASIPFLYISAPSQMETCY